MDPDTTFALAITHVAAYMGVVALWSKEFYRLQEGGKRLVAHVVGCALWVVVGVVVLSTVDAQYHFAASYLFMPALYLALLLSASAVTRKWHGRGLLPANRFNMQADSMKDARFSDYAFFIVIHLLPLIAPAIVFENVLGVPV